jgi:hypothetical protein
MNVSVRTTGCYLISYKIRTGLVVAAPGPRSAPRSSAERRSGERSMKNP